MGERPRPARPLAAGARGRQPRRDGLCGCWRVIAARREPWTLGGTFKKSARDGDAVAAKGLQQLADKAAANGLWVALYPHTGMWIESVRDAVRVAREVNRKNLGVTFNLSHSLMVGEEMRIPALLNEAAPYLFFVTINGADTGAAGGPWNRLIQPLGQGSFNVASVLWKLREFRCRGPIGLQGYGVALPVKENLARSMEAWKKLSARVAGP